LRTKRLILLYNTKLVYAGQFENYTLGSLKDKHKILSVHAWDYLF